MPENLYPEFRWWQGVVEDRNDPLRLGRCRVRIIGYHTANKSDIPTDKLPWAHPVQPITSSAMNGIGHAPIGPVEGTSVFGFFMDGDDCQEPVILGTLGGIPQNSADTSSGFNDPNGTYPKILNEPDTNRLAVNDLQKPHSVIEKKKSDIKENVSVAGGGNWSEPETLFNASYPFNHVFESESGHIKEYDDSPGVERIHEYHKSGSFYEIHPDGKRVLKIKGSDFEIIMDDKNVYIEGNYNLTANGNVNIKSNNGDLNFDVSGNCNLTVNGDCTEDISGSKTINASEMTINVGLFNLNQA